VQMPDYLDTTDLVTYQSGNRLITSSTGQWGDRLSSQIGRALAQSLAQELPQASIVSDFPFGTARLTVFVNISVFQGETTGSCVLAGRWAIVAHGGRELDSSEFRIATPLRNFQDPTVVAAMSRDVETLSTEIAARLKRFLPKASL
jgi:uncharacterized protein